MSFRDLLASKLAGIVTISPVQMDQLEAHYHLMVKWNQKLNLTSVRDEEGIVARHYCESIFVGAQLPVSPVSVVDVGSGAGFPGVPMAILRPDCHFTLVESHQRKAVFLKEAVRGFRHIAVAAVRAENLAATFDWMVCRAVQWRELPMLGETVALLLGLEDSKRAVVADIEWHQRLPVPWADREVLLIGTKACR